MQTSDLDRLARRITVVRGTGEGASAEVVFERKQKRRKGQPMFKLLEKLVRRSMTAQSTYAQDYLAHHEASNAKRGDGWLRDGVYNVARASRRAARVLGRGVL